jgi:3-deoxy-D-manno-octulosonic-acid transferase
VKGTVAYWVYNILATVFLLAGLALSPLLILLGKRYSMGLGQRLGFYGREVINAVNHSRPVWIHGASVGEALAAGRLLGEIRQRFPGRKVVVSAFTATGYETARRTISDAAVIFFPFDHPWCVKRALSTLDPSVVIFLETEIWPSLLRLAHRRGTPTLLLSGRLSARSFTKYSLLGWFFRGVIRRFASMGMQSEEDASRAKRLGADPEKVFVTGNLKLLGPEHSFDQNPAMPEFLPREQKSDGRCLLVVGSTHRGEEEILLDVFRNLKKSFSDFHMVLAPRHPQRFPEVEKLLRAKRLGFAKKSLCNGRSLFLQDICFVDTLGDLQKFYALGDIAFVGGSLVDAGGHNLLEPARLRKPILFGPYMANFAAIAEAMKAKGGGVEVTGADDLMRELADLLANPDKRRSMGEKAYQVALDEQRVGERSSKLLERYLQTL